MNKKFLIASMVLILGGEEIFMNIVKQLLQLTLQSPSPEAMQIAYISVMVLQLLVMLATVVFALLALREKSLKTLATIAAWASGIKLGYAVLTVIIGFFTSSLALS